jgi:predicted RND superfamily exporter protein
LRITADTVLRFVIPLVYGQRWLTFGALMVTTVVLGFFALRVQPDAGFEKQIPLDHEYMRVFKQYEKAFGGANLISIAILTKDGADIYNERVLGHLKRITDEVFFLPGVDRSRVTSLFTPGVRYIEIVEGGFSGGDVVPRNYAPSGQMFETIRHNVAKAGVIGRLVSNDQRGALVTAELLEFDPATGQKLDYRWLAAELEKIRGRYTSPTLYEYRAKRDVKTFKQGDLVAHGYANPGRMFLGRIAADRTNADDPVVYLRGGALEVAEKPNPDYDPKVSVHIIGFAKVVGDVTDASLEVIGYFFIAVGLTIVLLWMFCGSFRLSLLPLSAALTAVIWELGLLRLAGFGMDPFAILVPFLILSIGVSHGVQYINAWGNEVAFHGRNSFDASVETFRRLFVPGTVAIVTNVIGFATLAFIKIDIVREMAINAAMGMAAVIVTNKVMLPIVLSWVSVPNAEKFRRRQRMRQEMSDRLWRVLAGFTEPPRATLAIAGAAVLLCWAIWMYPKLTIGDQQVGVPELRPDGRYNRDSAAVVGNFAIGVDVLKVIGEARPYACVDWLAMDTIDRYTWAMRNVEGVQSALSLPLMARTIRAGWNEGSPKWAVLPRNKAAFAEMINPLPSSLGLSNPDCSALPVLLFTADHRAETISRIVAATKKFNEDNRDTGVNLALASGNVGVMAATNEEIKARELVVIIWVHLTLLLFVWLSFRSIASVICIITPLVLCSLLTYGGMALIGIGMKAATLPVAAFGVGIGVDAGIYIWSVIARNLAEGHGLRSAYYEALRSTGKAALFTSLSLIIAVFTWLFSELQFQADMGMLLLFMFTANLFGAILLLPALAWLCFRFDARAGVHLKPA